MELPTGQKVRPGLTVQDVQREFESLPYVDRVDVVRGTKETPLPDTAPPRFTLQAYSVTVALPLQGLEREIVVHPKRDTAKRLWKRLRRVVRRRILTPAAGDPDYEDDASLPGPSKGDAGGCSTVGGTPAPQDSSAPRALPSDIREAYAVLLGFMPRPGIRRFRVYNPLHVLEDELGDAPPDIVERLQGFKLLQRSTKDDRNGQEAWLVQVVEYRRSEILEVEEVATATHTGTAPTSIPLSLVEDAAGLAAIADRGQQPTDHPGAPLVVLGTAGMEVASPPVGIIVTAEMLPDDTKTLAALLKAAYKKLKAQGLEVEIGKDGNVTVFGEF